MSYLEEKIFTVLSADAIVTGLVSTRIYLENAGDNPTVPYVVYQTISTVPDHASDGRTGLEQVRVQFDCYAVDPIDSRAIATAIRDAMEAATTFRAQRAGQYGDPEPELALSRTIVDFDIWHRED